MNPKISYSHFEVDYLRELISNHYDHFDLQKMQLRLFNNGFNVIYHLTTTNGGSYMFRIRPSYDYYDINAENVNFVLQYQEFLRSRSFPVPKVLTLNDDTYFGCIDAPEGCRYFSTHEVVNGKSVFPLTTTQSRAMGKYLATMHLLSREFQPPVQRTYFTTQQMLRKPRDLLQSHPEIFRDNNEWFLEVISTIEERLDEVDLSDFVVIHGDFWHGNVLIDQDNSNINFIDFDFACYAPKELDLASFLILGYQRALSSDENFHQVDMMYEDMITGYHEVWEDAIDRNLILDIAIARLIWTIGGYIAVIGIQAFSGIRKRISTLTKILKRLIHLNNQL